MMRIPLGVLLFAGVCLPAHPVPTTTLVSVATSGAQANFRSGPCSISGDGRYIAFTSDATNLVPGDTNSEPDVFVRDTVAGTTIRVSVANDGTQANGRSDQPSISADGRYVAFTSAAYNLVPGDTNWTEDVFVRDIVAGTTTRVSVASDGTQTKSPYGSYHPAISADGRHVAFYSFAANLVPKDTNLKYDVFVRDTVAGTTIRASIATDGDQGNGDSYLPSISADGRYVAFNSEAMNLVPDDTNGGSDTFVRDTVAGTTTRVSVATDGTEGYTGSLDASISADGRYVAFASSSRNLKPYDPHHGGFDIYVRDTVAETTTHVSLKAEGEVGGASCYDPVISADGRFVSYYCQTTYAPPDDPNRRRGVYVRDTVAETTTRVSVTPDGTPPNAGSLDPAISADGRYVAFVSSATDLVPGDTNGREDVFVRGPLFDLPPFGDVDGDGRFTVSDVALALRYAAGLEAATPETAARADVLPDSVIDLGDVAVLLRSLAGA